jgi:hypothetical protein
MSKANGQAAKMSFSGHALMENRNGQRFRPEALEGRPRLDQRAVDRDVARPA